MARVKQPKLVVAFHTTTQALAFEAICNVGRLIPLPPQIRAGCGLAYCAHPQHATEIAALLAAHDIPYFAMDVVELYG